jgi:hypothetical protein
MFSYVTLRERSKSGVTSEMRFTPFRRPSGQDAEDAELRVFERLA